MPATTYRRPTTVHRNGKTFPRRGGTVRYHPGRDENPVLEALSAAGGWLGNKVWDGLESVSGLKGRKRRQEHDRLMVELVLERLSLRKSLHEITDPTERVRARRRIQELDRAWKEQRPAAPAEQPTRVECEGCGSEFDPEDGTTCTHGKDLCASFICRAEGCVECAGDIKDDIYD